MGSYYCNHCKAIALSMNLVSNVTYTTKIKLEVKTNYVDFSYSDREEVDGSEEDIEYVCIDCGYVLNEIEIEEKDLIKIINSFDNANQNYRSKTKEYWETYYYMLPIEFKEDITSKDIDEALFEFNLLR